jgi:peroxiredoxin
MKTIAFLLLILFTLKEGDFVKWGYIVRDSDGKQVDLPLIVMEKRCVLLNFYSTGCSECKKEIPFLNEIYKRYKEKGLEVLMVAVGEDEGSAEKIKKKFGIPFRVIADKHGKVSEEFGIGNFLPQSFFISKNMKVIKKFLGNLEIYKNSVYNLIEKILEVKK